MYGWMEFHRLIKNSLRTPVGSNENVDGESDAAKLGVLFNFLWLEIPISATMIV
jgi:hypothetical protein